MPDFDLRVFVPKEGIADPKRLIKVIENSLGAAAGAVQMEFYRTVGNWEHKPYFKIDKYPGRRIIYTDDPIYRYVCWGTKVRRVVMTKGFRPKSHPGSLYSGKGRGGVAFGPAMKINRPGIKARMFDTTIQTRWRIYLPDQLQRAIDSEFR